MPEIKKIIKETIKPIDHSISTMFGLESHSVAKIPPILQYATDQTSVNLSQVNINSKSTPFKENKKTEIATDDPSSTTILVRRVTPINSSPQNKALIHTYSVNT